MGAAAEYPDQSAAGRRSGWHCWWIGVHCWAVCQEGHKSLSYNEFFCTLFIKKNYWYLEAHRSHCSHNASPNYNQLDITQKVIISRSPAFSKGHKDVRCSKWLSFFTFWSSELSYSFNVDCIPFIKGYSFGWNPGRLGKNEIQMLKKRMLHVAIFPVILTTNM